MQKFTAKLFRNGRSQAVRLPQEFRFEGTEVYVRRNEKTGEIILSPVPSDWKDFFTLREQAKEEVTDFLRDRDDPPPQARKLI